MPIEELKIRIEALFSKYGRIVSSRVKMDPILRRPFAFVCYETYFEAEQAINNLNNTDPFKTGYKFS